MDFAISYSCGKDSTLALHKMLAAGHRPCCLLTMVNSGQGRSWFHGADAGMLKAYERSLGIPLHELPATGAEYAAVFEDGLARAKSLGVEACAFGDIDLEQNRLWEETRCANTGMEAIFPLWQQPRHEIVRDLLNFGYKCIIKAISTGKFANAASGEVEELCDTYLGRVLDSAFLGQIEAMGADICGENGEYHTLVVDGPVFRQPLSYRIGKILRLPDHAVAEITAV